MKYVFLYILVFLFTSCKEEELDLFPVTMEGANSISCLMNGKVWPSRNYTLDSYTGSSRQQEDGSYVYYYYVLCEAWFPDQIFPDQFSIRINFKDENIEIDKEYLLGRGWEDSYRARLTYIKEVPNAIDDIWDSEELQTTGYVKYLRVDGGVIAGVFEATMVDSVSGETLVITKGQFDAGNVKCENCIR